MKKTIIALFALCAMLLTMAPAFAAEVPTLEVSKATAAAGDTVDVTVTVKNSPGITAIILTIEYDDSNLTMEKVTFNIDDEDSFKMTSPTLDSGMKITWVDGLKDKEGTWLHATMTFKVKGTAPAGEYPVKISGTDVSNISEELISLTVQNGSVTVSAYRPSISPSESQNPQRPSASPEDQPKPSASTNDPPKTGDFAAPALWVCLMAVSGLAVALGFAGKKKRE